MIEGRVTLILLCQARLVLSGVRSCGAAFFGAGLASSAGRLQLFSRVPWISGRQAGMPPAGGMPALSWLLRGYRRPQLAAAAVVGPDLDLVAVAEVVLVGVEGQGHAAVAVAAGAVVLAHALRMFATVQ